MGINTCYFDAELKGNLCEQILDKLPANVFLYDLRIASTVYSNRSLTRSLGYSDGPEITDIELIRALMHPDDHKYTDEAQEFLSQAQDGEQYHLEHRLKHADGSWRWFAARIVVFARDEYGHPIHLLGISADVTNDKELQERFRHEANHDFLTKLMNRRSLIRELERVVSKGKQPLTICICDIDHFKEVNDAHGHLIGDSVLQSFADIMRTTLPRKEMIGRLGGDEFCVILPGLTRNCALNHIQKVRERFSTMIFRTESGEPFSVTASFGVSEWMPGMGWKEIMNSADKSLFDAKRSGRNLVA